MRQSIRFLIAALFLFCFSGVFCFAQGGASFAQLNGTLADPSGAAIGKASVSLKSLATNQTYPAITSASGAYVFASLPAGDYEFLASVPGFANYIQKGITLTVGETATLNVELRIAAQGETMTVTTEAPVIEPTKSEVSQVIDTKQIESLPTSGRLFTDFALLTPGVSTGRTSLGSTFTEFEITRISFGGMRDFSNEITVDGADNVNTITSSQRATPPQESVSEFRVVNNGFGAEYGRALGGIVNIVTKSGTNEFHVSAYGYLQNNVVDARSLLQPAPDADALRQGQFGLSVGGPIRADKTFFFANYEGERRGASPTFPSVLANNLGTIDAAEAALGIAPENLNILKTTDNDYGIAKVDHEINENNRISIRYNVENARDMNQLVGNTLDGGGVGTPSGGRDLYISDQSLAGSINSVITPNFINSGLLQYARRSYVFPGVTGEPDLSIPNTLEFGHNFGAFDSLYEAREQASDTMSWIHGSHVMKFGADANFLQDQTVLPAFSPERIILPAMNCLVDFANYVNANGGAPISQIPQGSPGGGPCPLPGFFDGVAAVQYSLPIPRGNFTNGYVGPSLSPAWQNAFSPAYTSNYAEKINHSYFGFFAQDQWRVTPRLTLNYGLRYDFEAGLSAFINPSHLGFQPRFGIAYSPNDKTVIRTGFGIFDDRYNLAFFFVTGDEAPLSIPGVQFPYSINPNGGAAINQINSPGFVPATGNTANFALNAAAVAAASILTGNYPPQYLSGPCPPSCTGLSGGIERDSKIPYSEQASIEIDRQLGKGLSIDVGYLFVGAHHLVRGNNLNVACPAGTSKPGNPASAQGLLNPNGTTGVCQGTPLLLFGKPYFSSANAGAEYPVGLLDYNNDVANASYNGLTVQIAEKLGSYFNLSANYTYSHTIDDGTFVTYVSLPQNQFDDSAERASSNQDVRQRFVANFTANTPHTGFFRKFQFSGIVTSQTGRPFTLFVGADSNGDTNPVTDRVGTAGRNTYTGDGLNTVDLRIQREFQVKERMKLFASVDAFNALNRANVDEVTSVYGSPGFCGAAPARYNDAASLAIQSGSVSCAGLIASVPAGAPPVPAGAGIPPAPNSLFGTPRTMFNPRQLQLGLKLTF